MSAWRGTTHLRRTTFAQTRVFTLLRVGSLINRKIPIRPINEGRHVCATISFSRDLRGSNCVHIGG